MKTVTLGQYRFRERNGKVYVYIVDGEKERYIGALHQIISELDSQIESKGQNNGKTMQTDKDIDSNFIRNNGIYESGISERELRKFIEYCKKIATERVCNKYANQLKKKVSNSHASIRAWRMYYRWRGEEEKLKKLKIPRSGSDLRYVSEEEVKEALSRADDQSRYILTLLLESGSRLSEIVKILSEYDPEKDKKENSYYIYELNWSRGKKRAYYFFHVSPLKQMTLSYDNTEVKLLRYINPKLIRKFVATKMFEFGIPAEIIDFIEGRAPSSIGTQHYIYLLTSAKRYYEEKWIPYVQYLLR